MKLDLSSLKNYSKTEYTNFSYRGVDGYAMLLGWEIIIFSDNKIDISAIHLDFQSEFEAINKASAEILEILGVNMKQLSNIEDLCENLNLYATENSVFDQKRYYFTDGYYIMCIGFLNKNMGLAHFEYSIHPEINKIIVDVITK